LNENTTVYEQKPITLEFRDHALEKRFRDVNQQKGVWLTRLAVGLGLLLYMGFTFLDVVIMEVLTPLTLFVRLIGVPAVFITGLILTYIRRDLLEELNTAAIIAAQLGHFILIGTGLYPPEYCLGITYIILLYLFTFSRVAFKRALIFGGLIMVIFEVMIIGWLKNEPQAYLSGNFFLISILAVCVLVGFTMERYLRREFIAQEELKKSQEKSEELLLNILPRTVAQDLKERGVTRPVRYKDVTVLFTDFVQFTNFADNLGAGPLVATLDRCFSYFDETTKIYNLEKIKTIGVSYMLAGGLPVENHTHAVESVLAGMTFLDYVHRERTRKDADIILPDIRIGINTGPVIAGVLGSRKFAFDIFGRTVNVASRVESCGTKSRVNISETTYERVKDFFLCSPREIREAKNGESYPVYGIKGIRPELSQAQEGQKPNPLFWKNLEEWSHSIIPEGLIAGGSSPLTEPRTLSLSPAEESEEDVLELLPLLEEE